MGGVQKIDPTDAGDVKYEFINSRNKAAFLQLETGLTPRLKIGTAGSGFRIVSPSGTVLLDVPETGFLGVPTLAVDPVPPAPAQVYIKTPGNALMFFDGATSQTVVLTP